jgi:hypothetical protein
MDRVKICRDDFLDVSRKYETLCRYACGGAIIVKNILGLCLFTHSTKFFRVLISLKIACC